MRNSRKYFFLILVLFKIGTSQVTVDFNPRIGTNFNDSLSIKIIITRLSNGDSAAIYLANSETSFTKNFGNIGVDSIVLTIHTYTHGMFSIKQGGSWLPGDRYFIYNKTSSSIINYSLLKSSRYFGYYINGRRGKILNKSAIPEIIKNGK